MNSSLKPSPGRFSNPLQRLVTFVVVWVIALGLVAASASEPPSIDPQQALDEGNRQFREGQIEQAIAAYRAGYSAYDPHPTLLYNLGTALHHLDRLPEAILWYRRAQVEDSWRDENLWLARRTLGSQTLPPGSLVSRLSAYLSWLKVMAIAVAWIALLVILLRPRLPGWSLGVAILLSLSFYALAAFTESFGPREVVLLEDCLSDQGELPAGTEAWARQLADGRWTISGTDGVTCTPDAVAAVRDAS